VIGPAQVVWVVERAVYGGIDLVARCVPASDDEGRRESLLDRLLDASG
jgi:hypothetical protein